MAAKEALVFPTQVGVILRTSFFIFRRIRVPHTGGGDPKKDPDRPYRN